MWPSFFSVTINSITAKGAIRMEFKLEIPQGFEELKLLGTLLSPTAADTGIIIMGEDYEKDSTEPTIWLYLVRLVGEEWHIQDELEAFTFTNYESAERFVADLPGMSAIDLLLLMNGHQATHTNNEMLQ